MPMKAISESWLCPSCGARLAGTPPEYRLCSDCLDQLESLGYEPAPGAPYGDLPPCPDCGGQMVEVVQIISDAHQNARDSADSAGKGV
jgi:hypothetical protein